MQNGNENQIINLEKGSLKIFNKKVKIGMTFDEVREIFGGEIEYISENYKQNSANIRLNETKAYELPIHIEIWFENNIVYKIEIYINDAYIRDEIVKKGDDYWKDYKRYADKFCRELVEKDMITQNITMNMSYFESECSEQFCYESDGYKLLSKYDYKAVGSYRICLEKKDRQIIDLENGAINIFGKQVQIGMSFDKIKENFVKEIERIMNFNVQNSAVIHFVKTEIYEIPSLVDIWFKNNIVEHVKINILPSRHLMKSYGYKGEDPQEILVKGATIFGENVAKELQYENQQKRVDVFCYGSEKYSFSANYDREIHEYWAYLFKR